MTKAELLKFLEPFSDEIKIVRFGHSSEEFLYESCDDIKYQIHHDIKGMSRDKIGNGEGFIIIGLNK